MKVLSKEYDILKELNHSRKFAKVADDKIWKTTTLVGRFRYDGKYGLIKQRVNLTKELKILEIGCGSGELTKRLLIEY